MFTGENILKTEVYGKKYPKNSDFREEISLKPRFTERNILKTEVYGKKLPKN